MKISMYVLVMSIWRVGYICWAFGNPYLCEYVALTKGFRFHTFIPKNGRTLFRKLRIIQ